MCSARIPKVIRSEAGAKFLKEEGEREMVIEGYEPVIGLEVHVQLNTKTKLFCNCSAEFTLEPNTHVCPVCMGYPGVLPVLNEEALKKAIKSALALNCTISKYSKFDRKNYFYPDLPKGYQISQYDLPLGINGWIELSSGKKIRIRRVHLEEDAGKLIHMHGESFVDFNRAGVPLIEIVSEPDINSVDEAYEYVTQLRSIMKYIEVSDVNMEEGSLRVDANISIRPAGTNILGTRVEIKNMNSFSALRKALEYEIQRQIKILKSGGVVNQETRLFDPETETTKAMRRKEEAHDYRYFPEPDLPPISLTDHYIEEIRKSLPELPAQKYKRFMEEYNLPPYDAQVLTMEKDIADYFENTLKHYTGNPKNVSNWIMSEVLRILNEQKITIKELGIPPENIAKLLKLVDDATISGKIAKTVFQEMIANPNKDPENIVKEKGLVQIANEDYIKDVCRKVLSASPEEVQKYKSGKTSVIGFFVGQVMKETKGKANPQMVNKILQELLETEF